MSRTALARMRRNDEGFGLVLVLAMSGILTALMLVATTTALRSLQSSRQHVNFEGALAVAEGGTDRALATAQLTYQTAGADTYLTPASGDSTCNLSEATFTWPTTWPIGGSQPTVDEERSWARAHLEDIATNASCRQQSAGGEFVTLKPAGRQTVYTMGWSPSYGTAEVKKRLIKSEYLFTPYKPTFAILTADSLSLDASTMVTSAPPNDPALAAVHTNGIITVSSGNPIVYGMVSQAGTGSTANSNKFYANTATGGDVTPKAKQTIPFLGARAVWGSKRLSNPPGGWYDLCPDGTARVPDKAEPCDATATILANVGSTGSFRGWSFDGSGTVKKWKAGTAIKTSGFSGTYYVHHADVLNDASNAGPAVPNLTVLASSSSLTCNKSGGNIDWGSTDPAAPSLSNTWLLADQDLRTSSNYQAGSASGPNVISGFFIAGDQIEMSTSSNGAYGAVVTAGQCDPPNGASMVDSNSIKNPSIYYDPNGQAPFIDIINTTLWLEYPG